MPKASNKKADEATRKYLYRHPNHETLTQYRDNELSPKKRGQVQEHVSSCSFCRGYFLELCGSL